MILAVLQARVSSSRLPGKVLKPILGEPMLSRQIERVLRTERIDKLVIATTAETSDDPIEQLCGELGIRCFRGSTDDVLDRIYRAAETFKPQTVVRITGDCPLFDPVLADAIIDHHSRCGADFTSNALSPTFPDGLDVEVVQMKTLQEAWGEAEKTSDREHVMPYICNHPERFRIESYTGSPDLSSLRWTVDEPEDFAFIRRVYEELYPDNPAFTTADVLELLDRNPDLKALNAKITRNEGFTKSTLAEQQDPKQ